MSDTIFNSFIRDVYGSGSSMHSFDVHIDGGFEIIGGADDISVESIFGNMHSINSRAGVEVNGAGIGEDFQIDGGVEVNGAGIGEDFQIDGGVEVEGAGMSEDFQIDGGVEVEGAGMSEDFQIDGVGIGEDFQIDGGDIVSGMNIFIGGHTEGSTQTEDTNITSVMSIAIGQQENNIDSPKTADSEDIIDDKDSKKNKKPHQVVGMGIGTGRLSAHDVALLLSEYN